MKNLKMLCVTSILVLYFGLSRSQTTSQMTIESAPDGISEIKFDEGGDGMLLRYDGRQIPAGINKFQIMDLNSGSQPLPILEVQRDTGYVRVGKGGSGNPLLILAADRSWAFTQFSSGAETALKLSAADANNNNKNFLINTDGFIGIRDDMPFHQMSLGSDLARTKLALYESPNNLENYGLGITDNQFLFNIGNDLARFSFFNDDAINATEIFTIKGNGFVGVSDPSPTHKLSLGSNLDRTKLALYESLDNSENYGLGVTDDQFRLNIGNNQARFAFYNDDAADAVEVFTIHGNGTVQVMGSTVHSSDRRRKEEITTVREEDILQAIRNMPIYEWQYKTQDRRHIGPMAQDFHRAFGLGEDVTTIASIDADGVALAAIQVLAAEIEALKKEIGDLTSKED